MPELETLAFRKRNLPHWYVADRPYFVTFRLKGTLPLSVVREHQEAMSLALREDLDILDIANLQREQFMKVEAILDNPNHAVQYLKEPRIAGLVMDAFCWLEREKGWRIYAAVVMPNHVHCCLRSTNGRSLCLGEDIGSLKKFTSRKANVLLERSGQFWQSENFDHWCRSPGKVEGSIRYIRDNPVKAGLVQCWKDWPWTIVDGDALPE